MGVRIAEVKIDGITYPMVFNNDVLEWMSEKGLSLEDLAHVDPMKGAAGMLKVVWYCIDSGLRYMKYKKSPEYEDVSRLSYEDFTMFTTAEDFPAFTQALSECMQGLRQVEAGLKKSTESGAEAREN